MSPGTRKRLDRIRQHLPPLNFITLHYAYFICTCLIAAIIFWGASTPAQSISFTDALFLAVSAMTEAGLNTVNLSTLNTFQEVVLFLMIMLGSTVLVSSAVVVIRKRAFEKRFAKIVEEQRQRRARSGTGGLSFVRSFTRRRTTVTAKDDAQVEPPVDGVVVRGRPIRSKSIDRQIVSPSYNPGDHPRPEQVPEGDSGESPAHGDHSLKEITEAESSAEASNGEIQEPRLRLRGGGDGEEEHGPMSPRQFTIRFTEDTAPAKRRHSRVFSMSGVGARPDFSSHPRQSQEPTTPTLSTGLTSEKEERRQSTAKYYLTGGFIGRNSQFHSLSLAERESLGGVEYRALEILEVIVPLYFVLFQLFGAVGCAAWVKVNAADTTLQSGLDPWWVGAFNAISAFNNSGMSLLDANMVAFQTSDYMLITMGLLILAGNTCYPIFLRLIIWTFWCMLPNDDLFRDTKIAARFLLDHPRRCYTTLFPSYHTWFLVGVVIALNGIDWFAYEVLNIGNSYVTSLPSNVRAITGLFQALAVRSGGFYVVPIANLSIGLQVLYVLMMYISVYPVTMSMRNTNVYEERSLGMYADEADASELFADAQGGTAEADEKKSFVGSLRRHLTNTQKLYKETGTHSRSYFVRQQLRSQLAHDLWWICLAVLFITIIEGSSFAADPVSYSVFNILFEVVSAYGTVGISVGLPNVAYSFCGGWHVLSKLILCGVMLRGRHRGLPVAIDRAVLLPGEHLARAEEEDARLRLERAATMTTGRSRAVSRVEGEGAV